MALWYGMDSNCGTLLRDWLCIISRTVLCYTASSMSPPKWLPYSQLIWHCTFMPPYSVYLISCLCHTTESQHTPLVLWHRGASEVVKSRASTLKRKSRKIQTSNIFHWPRTFKRPRNPKYPHISAPLLCIMTTVFMALLCHGRLCYFFLSVVTPLALISCHPTGFNIV